MGVDVSMQHASSSKVFRETRKLDVLKLTLEIWVDRLSGCPLKHSPKFLSGRHGALELLMIGDVKLYSINIYVKCWIWEVCK